MSTKNILLVCAAGMSTSLLVSKMKNVALEDGKDYEIEAISAGEFDNVLETKQMDVVLLGPQVRFRKKEFEKKLNGTGIQVGVIDMSDYGMMNGSKVLQFAESLL